MMKWGRRDARAGLGSALTGFAEAGSGVELTLYRHGIQTVEIARFDSSEVPEVELQVRRALERVDEAFQKNLCTLGSGAAKG